MSLTKVTYSMIDGPIVNAKDFGVVGDGTADDTTALQAFINHVTTNSLSGVIPSGVYRITTPITINITNGFSLRGESSTTTLFRAASTFSGGTSVIKILGDATANAWCIGGFGLGPQTGTSAGTATTGIQIGDATVASIGIFGFQYSKIYDVQVANFAKAWSIAHARMICFERCGAWNNDFPTANVGLYIEQNGSFTGDFVFDACQFVSSNAAGNKNIQIYSPVGPYTGVTGANSISGINFRACDLYSGERAIDVYASAGSYVSDMWFTDGVQIDQEVENGIRFESNDLSTLIENIHLNGIYCNKANGNAIGFASTGTGGNIKNVWVTDCNILRPQQAAINFFGASITNVNVVNNVIVDCANTGGAINFNTAENIVCYGNSAREGLFTSKPFYLVDIALGCDNIAVFNNIGLGAVTVSTVRDLSGDVDKTISDNIGYNPIPQKTITVGSSPFSYKNTSGAAEYVSIGAGTITALSLDGLGITPTTNNVIVVPPQSTLTVTYSSLPSMFSKGF